MARGENTGWDEFLQDVKNPLDDALNELKKRKRNVDLIEYRINYAKTHINDYTSTMSEETIADFNQRIKTTTGLLGVFYNDIDEAYELITKKIDLERVPKNLTDDVTPTLSNIISTAEETNIEYIPHGVNSNARKKVNDSIGSETRKYKEKIQAAIGVSPERLTRR